MRPDDILTLLKTNKNLQKFAVAFYEHLHQENPAREVAKDRSEEQIFMDNLGRLLVGDETCAAIAADGSNIYVATNKNNHSEAKIKVKFHKIVFHFSEDGKTATAQTEAVISSSTNEESQERIITKIMDLGQYRYESTTHSLIALEETIKVEVPYSEHGIDAFPYSWKYELIKEKSLVLSSSFKASPKAVYIYGQEEVIPFRPDSLFRRSAAVMTHLSTVISQSLPSINRSEILRKELEITLATHRHRVLSHTLVWELCKKYKLNKTIRQNDTSNLNKQAKQDYESKRESLNGLQEFIRKLSENFNGYLNTNDLPIELSLLIKKWRIQIFLDIYHEKINPPDIILSTPSFSINKFLEMFHVYLFNLLQAEQYVRKKASTNPNAFIKTLIKIGTKEFTSNSLKSRLVIVDDLPDGSHAEMRLFSRLMLDNQRNPENVYFGITQLCCVNCHTFFKSQHLDLIQGSAHRAGTHGKHYPNWVFGTKLRRPEILERFLGPSYPYFMALDDNAQLNGETKTCKEWAFLIIQDLAGLWFTSSEERLKELDALGFKHGGIFREGSNYIERSDQVDQEQKQNVQYQMR